MNITVEGVTAGLICLGVLAGVIVIGVLVSLLLKRLAGPDPACKGPKVVVWLQHGGERGWLKAFKPDGTPELTTDVFERKIAHVSEVEDGAYLLWRLGWVVSILRGWSFQTRFEERCEREGKIARATEACEAFCDEMKDN